MRSNTSNESNELVESSIGKDNKDNTKTYYFKDDGSLLEIPSYMSEIFIVRRKAGRQAGEYYYYDRAVWVGPHYWNSWMDNNTLCNMDGTFLDKERPLLGRPKQRKNGTPILNEEGQATYENSLDVKREERSRKIFINGFAKEVTTKHRLSDRKLENKNNPNKNKRTTLTPQPFAKVADRNLRVKKYGVSLAFLNGEKVPGREAILDQEGDVSYRLRVIEEMDGRTYINTILTKDANDQEILQEIPQTEVVLRQTLNKRKYKDKLKSSKLSQSAVSSIPISIPSLNNGEISSSSVPSPFILTERLLQSEYDANVNASASSHSHLSPRGISPSRLLNFFPPSPVALVGEEAYIDSLLGPHQNNN